MIYQYNNTSKTARMLRKALKIKKYRLGLDSKKIQINWGSSKCPKKKNVLNKPDCVKNAINKLTTLSILSKENISCPEFTINEEVAKDWDKNNYCVSRKLLCSRGGNGIELKFIPNCKLYVKYIKKAKEYRVHIFNNCVIDIQEKRKKKDIFNKENKEAYKIRNLKNGWVFCRLNVLEGIDNELKDLALRTASALGLDFCAVDIIYNKKKNKYYVLEVNTAPGLMNTTLDIYIEKFKEWIQSLQN